MSIFRVGGTNAYMGALSDTKPSPVLPGSTYYEHDTDKNFICVDGLTWAEVGTIETADLSAWNGAAWERVRVASLQKDLNGVDISAIASVWTPGASKKFCLMGGTISVSAAGSVVFEDNAAGAVVFRTPKLAADSPYTFVVNGGQGRLSAAANQVLKATLSAAGTITGTLWGTEE